MPSRVLIVEDEQIIAEDLAIQIGRMGHDVLGIAISGEEAVAMAEQTEPEVVLMDVQLEGPMTGAEAAQIIQERTGAGIVFVTAFPDPVVRETSHARHAGICVGKPFSRPQLDAALRAAARSRERPRESS